MNKTLNHYNDLSSIDIARVLNSIGDYKLIGVSNGMASSNLDTFHSDNNIYNTVSFGIGYGIEISDNINSIYLEFVIQWTILQFKFSNYGYSIEYRYKWGNNNWAAWRKIL